jgi:hypothetical protein
MDEIQKLYNLLVDNGYYTKSFDEFKVKFKDPSYQDKVYGVLTRDGLYKKDTSEFKKKYAVAEQVVTEPEVAKQPDKKKVVTEPPIATALPSGDGSLVSPKPETEQDYFTGAFGKVLKGFDEIVPLGIGDFVDDIARSVAQGYRQGTAAQEADKLLLKGTKATPEQIQKFINAQKDAQQLGESAEMKEYQKIYEGEGKGFWGVIKGLASNPSIIPQVMYSSLSAMATNTDALKAGATAVGTGTAIGAGTGAAAGGVGAIPGAIAGATASLPYAFGLASSVVEAGSTFGELLTEELGGKEMTKENVKNILEDPNKLQSIRNKAIARGLVIGTVDALTGKLASGVGAKVIGKSAAKSATGAVTKGAVVRATAAGAGVEAVGGSAGEAAARAAIGQDMDVSEIALEGLAELPGGIRSTIQARLAKPTYKVNGEKVTAQEVDDIIETMTPEQLAKTDIKIENDYEGRNYKIQDKIVTGQLRKDIRDANPDANEKTIDELVRLEKELKKFEGNNTQSGKDKAAAIRSQIRNVQEKGVTEEEAAIVTEEEAPEQEMTLEQELRNEFKEDYDFYESVSESSSQVLRESSQEFLSNPKEFFEKKLRAANYILSQDPNDETAKRMLKEATEKLDKWNEITNKYKQDAIQKQSTDESLLRSEGPELGLQQMGERDQEPEVTPQRTEEAITPEVTQEEVVPTEQEQELERFRLTEEVDRKKNAISRAENTQQAIAEYNDAKKALDDFDASISQQKNERRAKSNVASLIDEENNYAQQSNYEFEELHKQDPRLAALERAKDMVSWIESGDFEKTFIEDGNTPEEAKARAERSLNANNRDIADLQADLEANPVVSLKTQEEATEKKEKEKVKAEEKKTKFAKDETVRPESTRDRTGRTEVSTIAPLEGAPSVQGVNGPDPQLVAVAEQYAKDNGIPFKRQAEYVKVDEERARRIADAYEAMANDPQNPKVKEAYQNLINQTIAQYQALVDAGYKFWFMDLNIPSNVEYASSPYNAIRDLRQNKEMGVFPTTDGYGESELSESDVENNPMLQDTGIQWPVGGLDGQMKNVLANDLFRAVHDAFGHGLEGAGFRARGEENAWQAHVRLFTGSAIGAITSETRGQNSWLNFGPHGEKNRTAKVEDTVFAEQKVGLMPEWTWQEGRASDMQPKESVDAMLDLDVSTEDNLQKVLNVLDKIDNDISQRLRSGANEALLAIPLSTVQVVVKAVKALVKGGMALRDAIKKVSVDNNLTEKQVSDVFNKTIKEPLYSDLSVEGTGIKLSGNEEIKKGDNTPTITTIDGYQDDYSEDDILNTEHAPNSRVITYASDIASGQISYTKKGKKITFKLPYVNKAAVKKINSLREKYKAVKGTGKEAKAQKDKLKKEINKVAKQVLKDFTDVMTQNLLALYDTLTPEFIANSKNWYVGANRMANAIAQKYNMTIEQVGGIIGVLSPQNDWFNNVSVAERVINIMTKYGDTKLTKDIVDKAVQYNSRTGQPNDFANDLLGLFNQYGEVSINELDKLGVSPLTQSAILRAFDQALNSPKVAMTDPQGKFVGFDKTPVRWNSEGEISKAIGIFRNGDINNINENLGDGNKVRNFYNNIVDPNSKTPYVTADTHALSAALNGPISAKDAGGFGLFNGSLEPAYALVKSAYIKAAQIAGIKPREMQSITWEAQRIGINDKNRTEKNKQETFDYLEESRTNEKTSYERATELIARNRSGDPEWGKSRGIKTQKTSDEIRKGAELRSQQRVSTISNLRGRTDGGLGEADTEVGGGVTGREAVNEILDLDVTDKDNLQTVLDFLDNIDNKIKGRLFSGANESLFALPLSTIQVIVKAVKVLVKGGMALRDAIKKVAADNNVTESDVINSIQTAARILEQQGKPEGVSEMELPGYNRMINELEGVIEKSRERGLDEAKAMENAIAYLQGSKVYEDASDTQREKMVRDVRKMFGKRERPAPKPDKLFGEAKDVKMITMSEYDLTIKQIKDLARGAKDAKALWSKISAELVKYLKSMVLGGHVTTKQVTAILRKFSSVNMFNDKSIEKFVEYMAKVFKNADYAEQISKINAMLPTARKNAMTKLGIAEGLTPLLQRLFSINPTLIPDSVFDKYTQIVTMIGEKKTVLQLNEISEVTNTVNDILSAVDEEVSLSEELAERFDSYQDKVVDENGKINFAETVKQMLKDNVITEEEADIMRKYKNTILPREGKEARSEDEIKQENEALVNMMRTMDVDYEQLPTKDERNLARELKRLIKTDGILGLDNTQLKNLFRLIDNINNGYLPHYAQLMVERMNAVNNSKQLDEAVMNAKPYKFSVIYAKLKSLITKKDKFSELIRRNPLYYIDQVLGNFKTKNIFNSLFEKSADAQAQFQKSITELNNRLQKAEDALARSFKYNANKILESKFKMMTYMIQLEYESNPNNKQVNPAGEYLTKTIKHILNGKSSFGERDANILQKIYDEYADANGNIDINKLYDSFNEAEKGAIKTIQKINEELRDKAVYTAAIIRGDRINPLNNYVHLNVLHEHRPDEAVSGVAFVDDYNNSMRPSTKAKSLIERTGKVAPLNFDIFASANRGAKFVLMDYYLTEPIRTARKTINETSKLMEEQGSNKKQRDIFNAIDRAFEETVENLLTTNFTSTSFGDDVVNFISKQGYRAVLASVPRFIGELSSNIFFALIASPKDFMSGVSNKGVVLSPNSATIMSNVGSKQTNRLFPHDTLSGRLIDTSIMNEASGVRGGRAQSDVANKIQQIYNISLKKYQNTIETMADALISTPDKMVMRPMWFGAFSNEFKKQTGDDVDFDKIADGDERYMARYKEAIEKARMVADEKTVLTGATDNAFMGILKGTPKQNQSAMLRGFNIFNNYMTRFLIYEYATARTGIMAAMGNGSISRKQGVALLGAVTTRMTTYTLVTSILSAAMVDMFTGGDDEEDEKSFLQKVGQSITSSVTSLLLGRDFGNATKSLVNYGIERFNENYLDFLREGEYDPYKDALQYSVIPPERKGKKTDAGDLILNMMGPFGPAAKTADLIVRKATEPDKKQEEAIQRSESETNIRIPLEVLGNLGMIPLYKDVRKVVNAELYKELNTTEQKAPMNKIGKEDMKRYFPDMYNDLYGEGGALYDIEEMKKEIRKDKEELSRKIKDEMYEYTPKQKEKKKK